MFSKLNLILKDLKKSKKIKCFFIGNTVKKESSNFYISDTRESSKFIYSSIIVYNDLYTKKICEFIDGKTDYIFVDSEKKTISKSKKNLVNLTKLYKCQSIDHFVNNINKRSFLKNTFIISISAPFKLPLNKFSNKLIFLNIHCGKLPEFAGMMPIFWQIYSNLKKITITLHYMNEEIDTGSIIKEHQMYIDKTLFKTSVEAKKKSARILYDYLTNPYESKMNNNNFKIKLNKFPNKEQILQLNKKFKLI